jgi:hypothetical protein
MDEAGFGTATDYHELNAGAHRKPSKNLTAPALVRHMAFWTHVKTEKKPPEEDGDDKDSMESAEEKAAEARTNEIKDKLDTFILNLCRAILRSGGNVEAISSISDICKVEAIPSVSGFFLLFNSYSHAVPFDTMEDPLTQRQQDILATSFDLIEGPLTQRQQDILTSTRRAITIKFKWKNFDVAIRFEIHTEYFSISTFVEFDKARAGPDYSDLRDMNAKIDLLLDYLKTSNLQKADDIDRYFFRGFWETFEKEVLSYPLVQECTRDAIFQNVFADFRGFIFSEQAIEFTSDDEALRQGKPPQWGRDAKKKFLPLIQDKWDNDRRRYEVAVNYVIDGRAFYMSALAPQMPSMPADQRIPLDFIVYVNQRPRNSKTVVNRWQLGRLIDRLLLLGTLRLCALKEVKLLHGAGHKLAQLDESTQDAREAIAKAEAEASALRRRALESKAKSPVQKNEQPPPTDQSAVPDRKPAPDGNTNELDALNAKAMDLIAKAHQRLNSITHTFFDQTGTGLLYRIERSRYYVKQFDDNIKWLRIKRVEGDQPYDQFIKKRLGSEFDFIDRLGIRYERALRSMVTLDQNFLAITQNRLVERANQIDNDIRVIQMWGEFVLFLALVPYYITHLLVLIFGEEKATLTAVNVWLLCGALALAKHYTIWRRAPNLANEISKFVSAFVKKTSVRSIVPDRLVNKINEAVAKSRSVLWTKRIWIAAISTVFLLAVIEFFTVKSQHDRPLQHELETANCYLAQGLRILEKSGPVAPVDCEPQRKPVEHKIAPAASKHEPETLKPAPTGQPQPSTTDSSTPSLTSAPPAAQEVQPDKPKAQSETPPAAEPATSSPPPPNVKQP